MNISLRRGERFFVNGAVLRVDRKVCIELLNDVNFLLEHLIIQPDEATTPLKQLYLTIQNIILSPLNRKESLTISLGLIKSILVINDDSSIANELPQIRLLLESERPFEALKSLRNLIFQSQAQALNDIGQ